MSATSMPHTPEQMSHKWIVISFLIASDGRVVLWTLSDDTFLYSSKDPCSTTKAGGDEDGIGYLDT